MDIALRLALGFRLGHILGCRQHLGHPLGAGFALGIHDKNTGHAQHSVEDHNEILQEGHDDTGLHLAVVDPKRTDEHHQGQTQIQGQRRGRIGDRRHRARLLIHRGQFTVHGMETLLFKLGLAQGLDDPDAGDVLLHHPHHPVQHRLLPGVQRQAGLGHEVGHQGDDGQQRNEHQRQGCIHTKHHKDAAHQQDGGSDANALESRQQLINIIGVAGEAGFSRGNGQLVHLPGREAFQPLEQIMANGLGDSPGTDGAHPVGDDVQRQAAESAQDHQTAEEIYAAQIAGRHFLI